MKVQLRRRIAIITVLIFIAAGLVYGFWPKPSLVDSATVKQAPMQVTVEEEGRTRVIDRYLVSAPVAGYARRIKYDVGDTVQAGQTIADLEPLRSTVLDPRSRAEAQARVSAAKAALKAAQQQAKAAKAATEFAQLEYKRIANLCDINCASEEEKDRTRTKAQQAKANLRSSEFAVEIAQYELAAAETALRYSAAQKKHNTADDMEVMEKVAIQSPVNGRVLKIFRESEGVVQPGDPLLEVGDPSALEVEIDVLSIDAVRIQPGTKVEFHRWGGDEPLQGQVRTIEPVGFTKISALGVEEQRVLVIADITSPRKLWKRLGDGYRVEAKFILWESDNVLQIPTSALFRRDSQWAVYVVENERAVVTPVEIGHRSGLVAQVLKGITNGQLVITHPIDLLSDNARVSVR